MIILVEVTVIVPTLNEAEGIGPTIKEVLEVLDNPEILVIDASSTDGTPEIAASLGAKVIRQLNRGKGRAMNQVLPFVKKDTEWLVITDGDYAYPATYVPYMVKILESNPNVGMVTGRRISSKPKTLQKRFRDRPLSELQHYSFILLHNILNRVYMEDPTSGLRVLRYDCIRDFRFEAEGFDIEVELNGLVRRKGYQIVEVPVVIRQRLGKDKWGGFQYPKHLFTIFRRMVITELKMLFHLD